VGLEPQPWQSDVILAAAVAMHRTLAVRARSIGGDLSSKLNRNAWVVVAAGRRRDVDVTDESGALAIALPAEGRVLRLDHIAWRPGAALFSGRLDGRMFTATVAPGAEGFTIRFRAVRQRVLVMTPMSADLHQRLPVKVAPDTSRLVVSPMPGLVVSVDVVEGEEIKEGQVICVIEAMKMQNIIRAERDGTIKVLGAKPGDSVAADDVLAQFA
jgi:propionyl-CoA carboxylase alpha chain